MSNQSWIQLLNVNQVNGSALANTTVPTSVLPVAAIYTLPNNFIDVISRSIRVSIAARISTLATSPGTFQLDLKFGANIVASTGAMTLNTSAQTTTSLSMNWLITARAVGTNGNFIHSATVVSGALLSGLAAVYPQPIAVGTNFDTTQAYAVDLFGTWSVASSSNSFQLHMFMFESLN